MIATSAERTVAVNTREVPESLRDRMKVACAERKISMQDYVIGLIKKDLNSKQEAIESEMERAREIGQLPRCQHQAALLDWGGEELTPPCGCRFIQK